ncbi:MULTISPECIES: energy-coupling factor ABC transporter ATP-binding protein [unclassified Granulicatella]|uniref:energy-coupling factor ABC transporter ATP-binding protein n=1 Tax=unclassified Granulicatella TaxID=2630493 RepID=UPI001074923C|nr:MULTISPECIES: energy-coupling factor ABC transporter ATP-binding protein [unclassified Granulicatella]MBF0780698.1 energy-coupling factor ABC transporter ATP-binding protein [Granulicatella sp. 19428wC4_WM01]TFU94218.1 energy-coupling factor ABC transporter ATP-binding protein [Granulicatella sp. WM01]
MSINFEQVGFIYHEHTPFEHIGLNNLSFQINTGDYVAIIGHTGSGKSTLIQHLNALLKPTQGKVTIHTFEINSETPEKDLRALRQHVGVVFQFPESQLFEETVLKDVMFGPLNFGDTPEIAEQKAIEALKTVGISENLFKRSPFELSGGQMRRVSIAGILAIQPRILVLDEPTAGLDPKGRHDMMHLFKQLHQQHNMTIILVTHQMDDVAHYADKVLVMSKGKLIKCGTPLDIFSQREWLSEHHIALPSALECAYRLRQKGIDVPENILTTTELISYLKTKMSKGGNYAK